MHSMLNAIVLQFRSFACHFQLPRSRFARNAYSVCYPAGAELADLVEEEE